MGSDVDRIAFCLEELNECWSRLIEIGIGLPLLTKQLGWVSVTPLVVVGRKSSSEAESNTEPSQSQQLEAPSSRTSSVRARRYGLMLLSVVSKSPTRY